MITEVVTSAYSPPRIRRSSCVDVTMASAASRPPMASDPVSPMKILAGAAFHHRKPATAPMAPAATMATSSAGPTPIG